MMWNTAMPTILPAKPPMQPATVLFGLTAGASLRFPKARPAKKAPVSLMNAPTKGASTTAAERSRSIARLAKPRGSASAPKRPAMSVLKLTAPGLPCVTMAVAKT